MCTPSCRCLCHSWARPPLLHRSWPLPGPVCCNLIKLKRWIGTPGSSAIIAIFIVSGVLTISSPPNFNEQKEEESWDILSMRVLNCFDACYLTPWVQPVQLFCQVSSHPKWSDYPAGSRWSAPWWVALWDDPNLKWPTGKIWDVPMMYQFVII